MLKKSIFTIAAALSLLLPFTLSAQTEDPEGKYSGMFVVQKNIDYNYEKMSGTLSIESYLKGEITATRKPLDIVLVLDASGSMNDPHPNGVQNYVPYYPKKDLIPGKNFIGWTAVNFGMSAIGTSSFDDRNSGYYIEYPLGSKTYYEVHYSNKRNVFDTDHIRAFFTKDGVIYYLANPDENFDHELRDDEITTSDDANNIAPGAAIFRRTLYKKESSKLGSLKAAVDDFVNIIAADDAEQTSLEHRISIVKFADDKYNNNNTSIDNATTTVKDKQTTGITEVICGFTSTSTLANVTTILNSVEAIVGNQATAADFGMKLAEKLVSGGRSDADKVVILFTDGEPNHGSGFVDTVADSAISISESLKENGVRVYTVGLFGGTITDTQMVKIDKYMNGVSSNYPKATEYTSLGNGGNMGFYQDATELDLSTVFSDIAEDIKNMSSLDTHTLVKDVATPSFTLPSAVSADNIKIYTATLTSASGSDYQFGDNKQENIDDFNVSIVTEEDGEQSLEVSGFDYKENWCGPTHTGKKLIVELPFSLKPTKALMDELKEKSEFSTNKDGSGVYSEYGSYLVKKIQGSTIPFKSLTINMKGLAEGESAIIKLVKTPASGDVKEVTRIVLTGTSEETVSYTVPFLDPTATYTATQETWIWTYGKTENNSWTYGSSTKSQTQDMTETGNNFVMEFTNKKSDRSKYQSNKEAIKK